MIFITQEALLTHLREGGHPYLCLFDLEKAFDSIEHSVLLERLLQIGIGGKTWRVISDWYVSAASSVRIGSVLSEPVPILRGGSVLSPLLFILTVDVLLKDLKSSDTGLSVLGTFVGGAAHADDVTVTLVLLLVNVSHDHKIVIKSPFIFYTNYGSTTKIY